MFFGVQTVRADLRLHKAQAGLVTSGVLVGTNVTTAFTQAYANVCLWPENEASALGIGGMPFGDSTVTAWRDGETTAPKPDDKWTINGVSYLIVSIRKRHNHDEAAKSCAIYDCGVSRAL